LKTSVLITLTLIFAAALGFSGLVYAQARNPARTAAGGTAALSNVRGRVVYADTGNPVRRAAVSIENATTGEHIGDSVTDVKGEFSFNNLPAGRYYVSVSAPNLVDPSVISRHDADAELLDLAESQDLTNEIELDGNRSADIVIRARRGGAITGRVTTDDDEPVAGAQLRLFRLRRGDLTRVTSTWYTLDVNKKSLTTDSRGVYRIAGLFPGEYIVRAAESDLGDGVESAEGDTYGDGSLVVTYFPSAVSVKDAAPVRVYEGRDTDKVDIRIPERPARKLGGVVTLKRGGGAVGGAEITVTRKDEELSSRGRGFGDESARADANGRFEILGVPDGEYVVTVSAVVAFVSAGDAGMRHLRVVPLQREVTVNGADLNDLKFELEEGNRVLGAVTFEGGKARPERVWLEALRNGEVVDTAFVRDDGRFEFDTVPGGEIRLRVAGFPEDRFYLKSLTLNQSNLMQEPVRVSADAAVEGVRVVLSAEVITLKGQALSRRDGTAPLSRAFVVLIPANERTRRAGARQRVVRADTKGRFETAAGPGEYLLVALPEQAPLKGNVKIDEEFIRRSRATLTRVTLKLGDNVSGVKVLGGEE
jgi:hypothetical protein